MTSPTSIPGPADPPSTLSDADVVARILAGEPALFEILIRRYNQRLYRIARSVLRDDAEAEDVLQQAYVSAFGHLDQFAGRAQFSTWLAKIVFHEALARYRRRRREVALAPSSETEEDAMNRIESRSPNPEQQALLGELRGHLEAVIDALPATYRVVFVLREVEGMSTSETAACLDLREDAVKTRLHRARAILREELYQRAGVAAASAYAFDLSRCDRVVAGVFARLGIEAGTALRPSRPASVPRPRRR
jgi:RNA polymerase sigma-70 factor (ECF subfamily)